MKNLTSEDRSIADDIYRITVYWEPSVAKVTKSYSRRLPALERFYWETKFSLLSQPKLDLESQTKHFRGSPEFPNQSLRQICPGFPGLSDKQTNRHPNMD